MVGGGSKRDRYVQATKGQFNSAYHVQFISDEEHLYCLEARWNDPKRVLLSAHMVHKQPADPSIHTRSLVN